MRILGSFLLGILIASLLEYIHHRFAGHAKRIRTKIYFEHHFHHGDPQEGGVTYREKLADRLPLVVVLLSFIALGLAPFLEWSSVGAVIAGSVAGYLYLEWIHHRMHHRLPSSAIGRWLWRYHYTHHFTSARVNFGFTSPLWDLVFRTYRRSEVVDFPRAKAPSGIAEMPGFLDHREPTD